MINIDQDSPRAPIPFEKLNVYDGLEINAERWAIEHGYHRRRQNLYFEALFEPGIVWGLGVHLIDPLSSADAENEQIICRIEIQPGIAIDCHGNVIVLPEKNEDGRRSFSVIINPPEQGSSTAHIVIRFVDREAGSESDPYTVKEVFRIDQKSEPPEPEEVEICRIELDSSCLTYQDEEKSTDEKNIISLPENSLYPGLGELNLCHRRFARLLPRKQIRVGVLALQHWGIDAADAALYQRLKALCASLSSLYPEMQSWVELVSEDDLSSSAAQVYDLLCLDGDYFLSAEGSKLLPMAEAEADSGVRSQSLKAYVNAGGRVLLDTPSYESSEAERNNLINTVFQGSELMEWSKLWEKRHPILCEPFTFGASPLFVNIDSGKKVLRVAAGEQLICTGGSLSALWRGEGAAYRADIRTAQELGANLLHLVWRLRQFSNLCEDERNRRSANRF